MPTATGSACRTGNDPACCSTWDIETRGDPLVLSSSSTGTSPHLGRRCCCCCPAGWSGVAGRWNASSTAVVLSCSRPAESPDQETSKGVSIAGTWEHRQFGMGGTYPARVALLRRSGDAPRDHKRLLEVHCWRRPMKEDDLAFHRWKGRQVFRRRVGARRRRCFCTGVPSLLVKQA